MPEKPVNSIIAEALKNAGVPPRNISIPEDKGDGGKPLSPTTGEPKGDSVGAELETQQQPTPPASPSTPVSTEPESRVLSEAKVAELLDQAARKFQSITDKRVALLQSQLQTVLSIQTSQAQDREKADFASLPEDEQLKRRLERLERGNHVNPAQPIAQQPVQFVSHLARFLDTVGLKVDDPRIDWAKDESDFDAGYQKFLTSVKAALTEDTRKAIEGVRTETEKEMGKLRKKLGVDKVTTSGSSGRGTPNLDGMTPLEKIQYGFLQEAAQSQIQK